MKIAWNFGWRKVYFEMDSSGCQYGFAWLLEHSPVKGSSCFNSFV